MIIGLQPKNLNLQFLTSLAADNGVQMSCFDVGRTYGKFPLYVELLTQLTHFHDICDEPDPLCTVVASTCRCLKTAFHVSIKSSLKDFFVWKTNRFLSMIIL